MDKRESQWWTTLAEWCERYALDEQTHDELFSIVIDAIHEDSAAELGSLGGLKGGTARAAKMTPHQRSAAARKAARVRWTRYSCSACGAEADPPPANVPMASSMAVAIATCASCGGSMQYTFNADPILPLPEGR